MGTYSKPGITNAEASLVGNPAAALSKAISGVASTFNTQIANMEASKNALTESTAALNQQANAIETSNTPNAASQTQDIIKKEIDRVYKLKYNSIGRDQSEAIKAESDLLNMVKKMPEIMAFYDEETNLYKKNIENGQAGNTISNIRTNKNSRGFYQSNAFENGKGIEVKYQDGQLLFAYGKGKDRFEQNAMNYYDGVKGGADSNIGYIDNDKYQGAYKATFNQYAKEFPALIQEIETESKKNGTITNTTQKKYDQQVNLIRTNLMQDRQLLNDIDSDEFQFLVGSAYLTPEGENEAFVGSKEQIERAQEAKVNYIMDQFAKVDVNGKPLTIKTKTDTNLAKEDKAKSSSNKPVNVYTLSTREQIAELGDEYVETRGEIKGAINDVVLMAPILTKYSPDDTSYLTYDDIVKKVNNETGSGQPFETKEKADEFLGKLEKSSIYAENKGKINVKNPISVLDSNFNELLNTVMKGRYKGINPATLSVFKDKYKDVEKTEIKTQAEFDKAYADLAPGDSITVNGKTYTKPKK